MLQEKATAARLPCLVYISGYQICRQCVLYRRLRLLLYIHFMRQHYAGRKLTVHAHVHPKAILRASSDMHIASATPQITSVNLFVKQQPHKHTTRKRSAPLTRCCTAHALRIQQMRTKQPPRQVRAPRSLVELGSERVAVLMCPLPEGGPLVEGVLRVAQLAVLGVYAVVPPHGRQVGCAPARPGLHGCAGWPPTALTVLPQLFFVVCASPYVHNSKDWQTSFWTKPALYADLEHLQHLNHVSGMPACLQAQGIRHMNGWRLGKYRPDHLTTRPMTQGTGSAPAAGNGKFAYSSSDICTYLRACAVSSAAAWNSAVYMLQGAAAEWPPSKP